jgi:hypothetical protein
MEDNEEMTYEGRLLALMGLLAEAKLKAKELFDFECELVELIVDHVDGGSNETVH